MGSWWVLGGFSGVISACASESLKLSKVAKLGKAEGATRKDRRKGGELRWRGFREALADVRGLVLEVFSLRGGSFSLPQDPPAQPCDHL